MIKKIAVTRRVPGVIHSVEIRVSADDLDGHIPLSENADDEIILYSRECECDQCQPKQPC